MPCRSSWAQTLKLLYLLCLRREKPNLKLSRALRESDIADLKKNQIEILELKKKKEKEK